MRQYSPLTLVSLGPGARVVEPMAPGRVTLDDPAFSVMTDLREVAAATTRPDETIDQAHAQMIRRGVRLLFALDAGGTVAGILTATDLLGEKPMRFMRDRGVSHAEILVEDIMTPGVFAVAPDVVDVMKPRRAPRSAQGGCGQRDGCGPALEICGSPDRSAASSHASPAFVKTRYSGLIAVDDRPADGGLGLAGGEERVRRNGRGRDPHSCAPAGMGGSSGMK